MAAFKFNTSHQKLAKSEDIKCYNFNMKKMVAGFIFNEGMDQVLLIRLRDNRPEWQAGKLNGIGGKIEEGETSAAAMVRECAEECGLETKESDWQYFLKVHHLGNVIDFYSLAYKGDKKNIKQLTDEEIGWYEVNDLPDNVIFNIRWRILLALENRIGEAFKPVEIHYI